jgi:hypothetical protein
MNQTKIFYTDMTKKTDAKTCKIHHPKISGENRCRICNKSRSEEE